MEVQLLNLIEIFGQPFHSKGKNLDDPLGKVSIDSRSFENGNFFVPLKGKNFDGHQFLNQVIAIGVQGAVISKDCNFLIPKELLHWRVDDTLIAFQEIAFLHRQALSIPVVAITGSVGKTTTKELIYSTLSTLGRITSTDKNNNNDIGVPLTLLSATTRDLAIVVEMGMRGLGQIERLSKCSRPDIAVITNIGTAHMALLGSRRNIAMAKCEITSYLDPKGVVIILAGDALLEEVLCSRWQGRIIRVGLKEKGRSSFSSTNKAEKEIDIIGLLDEEKWQLIYQDKKFELPLPGKHNANNFLLTLAVANELNIPLDLICNIKLLGSSFGRNRLITIKGITILDETYNSSPESVLALLDFLMTKNGRKFAVLGNMYELGSQSVQQHVQVIEHAVEIGITGLIVFGNGPEVEAMFLAGSTLSYIDLVSSPEEAFYLLKKWLKPGDYLLLKASRKVALERLIPLLKCL